MCNSSSSLIVRSVTLWTGHHTALSDIHSDPAFRKTICSLHIRYHVCHQGKMIMQDKLEKERNDAKNGVEEYVYEMRDKLHGVLEKFVSEEVSLSRIVYN